MRSKKLLILYAFLLIVAVVTMVQLWRLNQRPQEIGPRDYPEIKEEGILRMITEYNQSGYFVSGDTVQGFQYELSQAIAKLSGLEVQTHLEMSLAKSFEELSDNKCDVIARNIPITSEMRETTCSPNRSFSTSKSWYNVRQRRTTDKPLSVTNWI